jgi:hypothetical protein
MFKIGNNSNSNFKSNRQIPHSRIDDEESIFKKYELGKKLGQVIKIKWYEYQWFFNEKILV